MSLNVREFMHTLSKHNGPQYVNRYRVRMPTYNLPLIDKALGYEDANGRELNVLCSSVEIPSFDIELGAERRTSSRAAFAHPTGFNIGDANFIFIETADGLIRTYFEGWFDSIVNQYGEIAFYKDIVRDIYIDSLDKEGNVAMTVRLLDCFPQTRASYIYSDSDSETPLQLNVSMKVKNYEIISGTEGKVDRFVKRSSRFINRIGRIF